MRGGQARPVAGMCRRALLCVCLTLAAQSVWCADALLEFHVTGLQGEALENTVSHLGSPPYSVDERDNFLFSAQREVVQALNALGYYHPQVTLSLERSEPVWQLTIAVERGPQVVIGEVDLRIEGAARDDEAFVQLIEEIPIEPGQGLHHGTYEDFKSRLQTLGGKRGYLEGELARHQVSVNVDDDEALVELHYNSGERYRFGEVTFDEFPLDQLRLDQMMTFEPGEPFDLDKLQAFQADLQRSGYFGQALVRMQPVDSERKEVPVHVDLAPGDRHHYRVGVGYSTDTRERISLVWRTPLLNQRGHSQESRLVYSPVRPRFRFTYTIPRSHPTRDTLRTGARLEINEYGDLDSWQREVFLRREYQVRQNLILTGGARYLLEDWDVGPESRTNNYLLWRGTVSHSLHRGNPLDPEAGFSQLYGFEVGFDQAGSDIDLQRLYALFRGGYTLAPRHRLVGRVELGAVYFESEGRPDLAPSLSFFAGGNNSLRGYAYQSLGPTEDVDLPDGESVKVVVGGDRLAIASAEYQYYITPEWRGSVFVDAGNAFNAGDFDPVAGAGFGAHYVSPVGAIRVDFGYPISEDSNNWRVHLTLGAEF